MRYLYTIGIRVYALAIMFVSLFNKKAGKWVRGRKNWEKKLSGFERKDKPLYWFHCASLGEFEQGKPIMLALKKREDCQLVVSFFSPSGYEIRQNFELADLVFYLPLDTVRNANKLFHYLQPTKLFIVKYEFWANLIFKLSSNKVPVILISGIFRKNQSFFKWYGGFFKEILNSFKVIFVQDIASNLLLSTINVQSIISGDTRYDRVMANSAEAKTIQLIEQFCNGEKVFLVGSSWIDDDAVVMPLINKDSFKKKIIIAPHEVSDSRVSKIESQLSKSVVRYSTYDGTGNHEVLIIDNIGMLMHLYQYADIAYVGGGFKTGLHNILEPASFGVPVIFGPKNQKFPEAKLFIENGIGFEIDSADSLELCFESLALQDKKEAILAFMNKQTGATKAVLENIGDS